ncbi:MAG: alanine racemase, partial [Candidatus Subteraquimicrobiales bacterium]|nr:alanine racemase [Candidatus Subteraquimicrobiales bacterium]
CLRSLENIEVEGIFTHFALADNSQSSYTQVQFEKFKKLISELENKGFKIPIKHAANSAATMLFKETHLDMVRIGIALYGLHPSSSTRKILDLKPVLIWKAKVSFVKTLEAGEGVSYGLTYRVPKKTQIATIPLGYADGYTRLLSNKSEVLVNGKRAPVVGNICMDHLMINVGNIPDVVKGTEVVLIGKQKNEEISSDEIASILGTINYEVVCMINRRIPRVYC